MQRAPALARCSVVVTAALLAGLYACTPGPPVTAAARPARQAAAPPPPAAQRAVVADRHGASLAPGTVPARSAMPAQNGAPAARTLERLSALYAQRQDGAGDYALGPGDVLAVRAYDLEELNQRVRVDGNGTIALPLLDTVPVANRTVAEVEQELTRRLRAYMYAPKVTVFIEEYRSRQVAVVGAVQKPGLVTQTTRNATVLDAISAAGGRTGDASTRVYLLPAEDRLADARPPSGAIPEGASVRAGDESARDTDPLVFDAHEMPEQAQAVFLSLPVRAGDVIIVPGNGNFIVEGWVNKPGTYPLQPGLTLRGAIGIAEGLAFPAETSRVRIYRNTPGGGAETLDVNFDDVGAQRVPDVFLHEGDVVEVGSSKVKLVSYGAYKVITDLVKVGARITPF